MVHDSHKHIGILEFVQRKLSDKGRTAVKRKVG
jgi:hypothetical protein